jgi:hypothetical protein
LEDEIENFESKLLIDSTDGAYSLTEQQITEFLKAKSNLDPSIHMNQLIKVIENPNVLNSRSSKLYLEKIKFNRIEAETSRREQEKRRRKLLLLQQQTQQEMETEHLNEIIEQKLLRQSKQERRIAEQY